MANTADLNALAQRIDEILKWDGAWYANVGAKTGEQVCALLRDLKSALTTAATPPSEQLVALPPDMVGLLDKSFIAIPPTATPSAKSSAPERAK